MRKLFIGIGLTALLGSVPAHAADWDSAGGWDVYEIDATRCVVGRIFAETGATFGVIMSLSGEVRVFATAPRWSVRAGEKIDAAIGLDADILVAGPAVGIAQGGSQGFVLAAGDAFLARFPAARQLTMRMGSGAAMTSRVALAGNGAGLAQGRRCLASLREDGRVQAPGFTVTQRSLPPPAAARGFPAPTRVAMRAVPQGSKSSWIEAEDYPAAALRAEEQGLVTVKLAVNERGGVAACDIVRSSGSKTLDATTCQVIQRRARYRPATDATGHAVPSVDEHTVRWTLPAN